MQEPGITFESAALNFGRSTTTGRLQNRAATSMLPITSGSSESSATVDRLLTFVLSSLEEERRSVENGADFGRQLKRRKLLNSEAAFVFFGYLCPRAQGAL